MRPPLPTGDGEHPRLWTKGAALCRLRGQRCHVRHRQGFSPDVSAYLELLHSKGIAYSNGGDYLHLFAQCDAIVHDCGSFTAEWLFTGKPGCFVYSHRLSAEYMTTLMKKALSGYTIARSREDILAFLRRVADEPSPGEEKMADWVERDIAVNYPHASEAILKELDILSDVTEPS